MVAKLTFLVVVTIVAQAAADIIFENEEIKLEEIFDLDYARNGNVSISDSSVTTSYYCTFRSNWNVANHPALYPALARWGNPLMFSHTKQYAPFIKKRAAPSGVEQLVEVCGSRSYPYSVQFQQIHCHNLLISSPADTCNRFNFSLPTI
jgi:Spondin_N